MDPITMTLEQTKTTKGTTVYQEVIPEELGTPSGSRGHTFYLLKSVVPQQLAPDAIQITIEEIPNAGN